MKKLLLTSLVLFALTTGVACLDITPYPVVEVDAGEPELDADVGDAGADGE